MSKSDIFVNLKYERTKNVKASLNNWHKYASKKSKVDTTSVNNSSFLDDYYDTIYGTNEDNVSWNYNGDNNLKEELSSVTTKDGYLWKLVVSFPSDFALNNGLVTKKDFYDLTKNFMPDLMNNMGLDINNSNWCAVLHRNTRNPHMHISIYEYNTTKSSGVYPKSALYNLKSNIANYLVNNKDFYVLRDNTFNDIITKIKVNDYNKFKSQNLFSDDFRRELNRKLLALYKVLPDKGRLQYNSKNMLPYKEQLNDIIKYILLHDSVKYDYSNYIKLLNQHQKELSHIYGENSIYSINKKYYNEQLNRLYSKIGNEILNSFKIYKSAEQLDIEKQFLRAHILEMNFKSRSDYLKEETKYEIGKELYMLCKFLNISELKTNIILSNWAVKSKYNIDIKLLKTLVNNDYEIDITKFYKILNRLGYNYDRYSKLHSKYFYKDLNYKLFIHNCFNHLMYELDAEEKKIINNMQYELEVDMDISN